MAVEKRKTKGKKKKTDYFAKRKNQRLRQEKSQKMKKVDEFIR